MEFLEVELQSVLDLARPTVISDYAELRIAIDESTAVGKDPAQRVDVMSEAGTATVTDIALGTKYTAAVVLDIRVNRIRSELRLVEEVKELRTELHSHALSQLEVLVD